MVQDILTEFYDGELISGALGHKHLGRKIRQKVRQRFASKVNRLRYAFLLSFSPQPLLTVREMKIP